jgi:hypothetical protein
MLNAKDQLGSTQAVDAKITVKPAGKRNVHPSAAPGVKLADQLTD